MSKTKIKAKVVASKSKGSVKPKLSSNNGGILTLKVAKSVSKNKK